ncbi:MAG: fumarylacetoacetate hydrolase family protein [Rubrobacteraceae bacterium]
MDKDLKAEAKGAFLSKYQIGSGNVRGTERIILHTQGGFVDLSGLLGEDDLQEELSIEDAPGSLLQMIRRWDFWEEKLSDIVEYVADRGESTAVQYEVDEADIRWLPPLMYPSKLICIGSNYTDHVEEMGFVPEQEFPYSFLKPATNTLIGHRETVRLPERAEMIDWEVELAVIMGRTAKNVRGEEAMASIAGYTLFNDVSARDWVEDRTFMGFDWIMLKAFDTSGPMGPMITPARFVPDPQSLGVSLSVSGETKQDSHTSRMIFSVQALVEHLSDFMTLEPGDVIATGSPAGVGFGMKPPQFLKSGDVMVAEIESLGRLENPVG